MKVDIETETENNREYPWVGRYDFGVDGYSIVIFIRKGAGICIFSTEDLTLSNRTSEAWVEERFVPCKITLDSL